MLRKLSVFIFIISLFLCISAYANNLIMDANINYRHDLIYEPDLKTYFKSTPDNYVYFEAKFEPRAGVYIGTPHDRPYSGIDNAINTEYDWFDTSVGYTNEYCARKEIPETPSLHTTLTGYNWNFALKDKQINIADYSNYIYNKIDELAARGEDIILIFGKEFNIDNNFDDPELFKACFRFVSEYAKTKQNIAMCWAPNDTGDLNTALEDFYPGNAYVDWIGCSLYSMPNFQGNVNMDDGGNMCFIMGKYANPSIRAKIMHDFLQRHAIQKPVIITEGGVGFYDPDDGIDYTHWAAHQLKMYYSDICRRYPEFKCIVSFNHFVNGDLYRYDMGSNAALLNTMQNVTQDSIYLKNYPSSSPYAYTELYENIIFSDTFELSSYAYVPEKQNLLVLYYIDEKLHSVRSAPPYKINLSSDDLSSGYHTVTVSVFDGESSALSKDYTIFFN